MSDLTLQSRRVVTPQGVVAAAILIRDGRIEKLSEWDHPLPGPAFIDVGEDVLFPGLIDTHAHINEPGRTEWEGFRSATRAAAAGGITTLVDMPLNSIPATCSVAALRQKEAAARGNCWVDTGFLGGVIPGNRDDLKGLWEAGVLGFKCFLIDSGVAEFPPVERQDLEAALPILKEAGATLQLHAELASPMAVAQQNFLRKSAVERRVYAAYLASRPDDSEGEAIRMIIDLTRRHNVPTHIVHLSTATAVASLRAARKQGLPITVETCPHYLFFEAEQIPDGATPFKCAPPIRSAANRRRLWKALQNGHIDLVVSDHSPSPPFLKSLETGDFGRAWGGISSLQLRLPVLWTAASELGCDLTQIARWTSTEPARLVGLQATKGRIAEGFDADFCVWRPEQEFRVHAERLYHRHTLTPYDGLTLSGEVMSTWLRGTPIYRNGELSGEPLGRLIRHPADR